MQKSEIGKNEYRANTKKGANHKTRLLSEGIASLRKSIINIINGRIARRFLPSAAKKEISSADCSNSLQKSSEIQNYYVILSGVSKFIL